ncbi:winged helix-turn-helix transcriptional regulator [Alloalcanivorax marinus]|uniref:winged helix-turn-helix transcriptional regulator n=1 Tax=Alloalcanivorax marinus TaxID=1177169 RepID=UPI001933DFB3|nr:helix-turn-helix transcriptional regulator [Alloalcanivorax marinus]
MRWQDLDQEPCSLARALAVIGDRWTLMVLRDCFLGVRRFDHFQERLGVTRHVLSDRLRKLVHQGVLEKAAYQERPRREEYRLTDMGRALHPVIVHLVQWGDRYLADERGAPLLHEHRTCGHRLEARLTCGACGEPVAPRDVRVRQNPAFTDTLLPAPETGGGANRPPSPPERKPPRQESE